MDTTQNYYQLLHVLPDAPAPVIKASYRAMMQKLRHHPDLGGDPSLAQLLNLAADTLCDPDRRARYDSQLQESARLAAAKAQAAQSAADARRSSESAGGSPRRDSSEQQRSNSARESANESANDSSNSARNDSSEESVNGSSGSSSSDSAGKKGPRPEARRQQHSDNQPPQARASLPARPHCLFCGATRANAPARRQPYGAGKHCLRCAAPSVPIEELPQSLSDELRRIYRHDMQETVTLWSHWPKDNAVTGALHDLSLAGCAVSCRQELAVNSMVLVETSLLTAICQVRYCKPGHDGSAWQIGLQFRTLDIRAQPGTVFSTVA